MTSPTTGPSISELQAALYKMLAFASTMIEQHGMDGDDTMTDEQHQAWQDAAGDANHLLRGYQPPQPSAPAPSDEAQEPTSVAKTVFAFTLLHDGGENPRDLSLSDIADIADDGNGVGGRLMVLSHTPALTRQQLEVDAAALGSSDDFFLDGEKSWPTP